MSPLVMIPGWAMHSEVWGDWPTRRTRTIRLDLPGHGTRPRDERLNSLEALAGEAVARVPEPAVWLGWSLGGLVAMRVALDHPEKVLALVLVAATPCFVRKPGWPCGVDPAVFDQFACGLQQDFGGTLNRFFALEIHGSPTARRDLRTMRRRLSRYSPPAQLTLRDGLEMLQGTDLRSEIRALETPALLMAGNRDRLVAPAAATATADLLSNSQLEFFAAGHAPFVGRPQDCETTLDAFIENLNREPAT